MRKNQYAEEFDELFSNALAEATDTEPLDKDVDTGLFEGLELYDEEDLDIDELGEY